MLCLLDASGRSLCHFWVASSDSSAGTREADWAAGMKQATWQCCIELHCLACCSLPSAAAQPLLDGMPNHRRVQPARHGSSFMPAARTLQRLEATCHSERLPKSACWRYHLLSSSRDDGQSALPDSVGAAAAPASHGLSALDNPVPGRLQLPQPAPLVELSPRLVPPTAVSLPNEGAGEQQLAWEQQLVRGQQELAALQRMCSTVDRWAACHT